VDVDRAADLYAQGWTLRQIGAELGVHWSTVSNSHLPIGQVFSNSHRPLIGDGLATLPTHPDALVLPALVADTAVHVGRIGAVLEVVSTSRV
jgi:Homeodomain-like domain